MSKEAPGLAKHYRETAFMGFWEVLTNLGKIKENFRFCKQDVLDFKPDVIIFIDYPGFNLRMAKFAKSKGLKTVYYISPKVWVWKKNRVYTMRDTIDRIYSILPFEKAFYKKFGVDVEYVGNPLYDKCTDYLDRKITKPAFLEKNQLPFDEYIALLPGSRIQEIRKIMPELALVCKQFPHYPFIIAAMSELGKETYLPYLNSPNMHLVFDQTYDVAANSLAAVVTSGTAVLEAALLNVNQVAVYKTSLFTYEIGIRLVHVRYATLPNLILNRAMVEEVLQYKIVPRLTKSLLGLLHSQEVRQRMKADRDELIALLNRPNAARNAAISIHHFLKQN